MNMRNVELDTYEDISDAIKLRALRLAEGFRVFPSLYEEGYFFTLNNAYYSKYQIRKTNYGRREISCISPVIEYPIGIEDFIKKASEDEECIGFISLTPQIDVILKRCIQIK